MSIDSDECHSLRGFINIFTKVICDILWCSSRIEVNQSMFCPTSTSAASNHQWLVFKVCGKIISKRKQKAEVLVVF